VTPAADLASALPAKVISGWDFANATRKIHAIGRFRSGVEYTLAVPLYIAAMFGKHYLR
jgi:hypothetical protein